MLDGFALSYFTGGYTPPPGEEMPQSFLEALKLAAYPAAIWSSIWRLLQGYFIAVVVGFPLGLLVARFALAEKTIGWLSISLQSLPSICWVPLALLWFGRLNEAPILFVTVFGALFATVVAVADGIRNVPPLLARAGRTLGADGPRLYFSVLLPAALPNIVTGLKIGWSFAWRSLMAAELIVNSGGLGFLLERDRDNGDMEGVLATIIVIIVIGLAVQELVFAPLQKRLSTLWGLTGVRS
jgi:NitT/TauT family transport system permease protein